jgi:hypothetical protein
MTATKGKMDLAGDHSKDRMLECFVRFVPSCSDTVTTRRKYLQSVLCMMSQGQGSQQTRSCYGGQFLVDEKDYIVRRVLTIISCRRSFTYFPLTNFLQSASSIGGSNYVINLFQFTYQFFWIFVQKTSDSLLFVTRIIQTANFAPGVAHFLFLK